MGDGGARVAAGASGVTGNLGFSTDGGISNTCGAIGGGLNSAITIHTRSTRGSRACGASGLAATVSSSNVVAIGVSARLATSGIAIKGSGGTVAVGKTSNDLAANSSALGNANLAVGGNPDIAADNVDNNDGGVARMTDNTSNASASNGPMCNASAGNTGVNSIGGVTTGAIAIDKSGGGAAITGAAGTSKAISCAISLGSDIALNDSTKGEVTLSNGTKAVSTNSGIALGKTGKATAVNKTALNGSNASACLANLAGGA